MSLATTKQALVRWHDMVTTRDMSILNELLAEDVVFRSPVAFNPYPGKQVVFFILSNVIQVFENFTYHREFFTEDGLSVVLEFSAISKPIPPAPIIATFLPTGLRSRRTSI